MTISSKKTRQPPRSLKIAQKGITTAQQFSALMSAIMSDLQKNDTQKGFEIKTWRTLKTTNSGYKKIDRI